MSAAAAQPADPAPAPLRLPPREALRALLHSRLQVSLVDGRVLSGQLLAVDRSAALLLSGVTEHRTLPPTAEGHNVATYYPFSRVGGEEPGPAGGSGSGGARRARELASVLVPFRHVVGVELCDEDAAVWTHFAGVEVRDGVAVP
ncbi:hypothetical protein VHUM_03848 [Vanrija humicola]|uniref:Sm domain-containing protein n=1 Tax=Vanrija humicola TaxID=5417 RepID=A0A7D8UZI3_VANHU|nr:hypothetical protein VHUM_03848 [Vanrija humicola]